MKKYFFVYILRNNSGTLYIGITSNLTKRIWEHKNKLVEGFTQKYNIDKLIYYEVYEDSLIAISREKQLKNWSRKKKMWIIAQTNPECKEIELEEIL